MSRGPLRRRLRRLRKRAQRALVTRPFMWLAVRVVPGVYMAYMRLVWATSRIEDESFGRQYAARADYDGAVAMFWHEEVIAAPYGYYRAGVLCHTLVNLSDVGELVTRIAERCRFVVFRGGGSSRRSRRRTQVFRDMIEYMQRESDVLYGVAVDGSHGPAYHLKRGPVVIARDCDKPVFLARIWFARCVRLPTWDRTAVPLPFNRIHLYHRGPYRAPDDAGTKAGLERFRLALEQELAELAALSYREMGQALPAKLYRALARGGAEHPAPGADAGRDAGDRPG